MKSHGIATANRPYRMLQNCVVHPKDKARDEEKTELIYRVPCKNCSSSNVGETGSKFGLRIKEHKKEVDSFTAGTDMSLQGKGEQCNSQVSHHRPCRGREPCHRLGQGKSGRQRGTVTDQIDKRGTLDQKDTDVHESGAGSYQLSHTWDQVISRSRAPSSCKQSRPDQDVRRTSKRCH